jgi:hypothetical protein
MILRILHQDIPQQISDTFHLPKVRRKHGNSAHLPKVGKVQGEKKHGYRVLSMQ